MEKKLSTGTRFMRSYGNRIALVLALIVGGWFCTGWYFHPLLGIPLGLFFIPFFIYRLFED
jgi:hypothetical protein